MYEFHLFSFFGRLTIERHFEVTFTLDNKEIEATKSRDKSKSVEMHSKRMPTVTTVHAV